MIVGENAGCVAVNLHSLGPVFLRASTTAAATSTGVWIYRLGRGRSLAQIVGHVRTVAQRVQRGDYGFSVRADPQTDVERNSLRGFLRRIGAADVRRGLP